MQLFFFFKFFSKIDHKNVLNILNVMTKYIIIIFIFLKLFLVIKTNRIVVTYIIFY